MRNIFIFAVMLALVACAGKKGSPGLNGKDGTNGRDGNGCHVEQVENGAIITCGSTTALVLNGVNGRDGTNGQDGIDGKDGKDGLDATPSMYSVTQIINPCGSQGQFDEILFKLATGQLVAHYSDGKKQFLSLLTEGTYVTTDDTKCYFTVVKNGEDYSVTNEHN